MKKDRQCAICSKPTQQRKKYCSPRCLQIAKPAPPILILTCPCGAKFKRREKLPKSGRAFCSTKCSRASLITSESHLYRGGVKIGRGPGWKKLTQKIRERDGFTCRRCGRSEEELGETLAIDHVIPYRSFSNPVSANGPDNSNLLSLCKKCHGWKTSTIERKWLLGDCLGMLEFQKWVQRNGKEE